MRKIPTLFLRDFTEPSNGRYVTREPNPECQWVFDGEGAPTRKYDGTCVMLDETGWWARREVRPGKTEPAGFKAVERDNVTGKTVGWEPVGQSAFAKFHAEAVNATARDVNLALGDAPLFDPGTYELVGPKVNGNPEGFDRHRLIAHDLAETLDLTDDGDGPWTVDEIKHMVTWCSERGREGIVWHHPDGRMAKLKVRDFAVICGGCKAAIRCADRTEQRHERDCDRYDAFYDASDEELAEMVSKMGQGR